MKPLFIFGTFFFVLSLYSQNWFYDGALCYTGLASDTVAEKELIKDLATLGSVSLGDAGECSDWKSCLKPYTDVVAGFDSLFIDSTLIRIIKTSYCPLMISNAYLALLHTNDTTLTDVQLVDLIRPYKGITSLEVRLDWGCGSDTITLYEYLVKVCQGRLYHNFLPGVRELSQESIARLDE